MIDDDMLNRPFVEPECEVIEAEEEEVAVPFSLMDVLVYPISPAGLSVFCVYVFVPLVIYLLLSPLPTAVSNGLFMLTSTVYAGVCLSTFWYLTVCIRAGAEGQRRAPNVFEFSQDDTPGDWMREFFLILGTLVFCIGPAFLVRYIGQVESVVVFWGVMGAGLFLLPMYLLAVVIFDTVGALNPILIVGSIFSTFFPYMGVVFLFSVPMALTIGISIVSAVVNNPFLGLIFRALNLYLLMIAAGLLGRFFYKNEDKLRWDV